MRGCAGEMRRSCREPARNGARLRLTPKPVEQLKELGRTPGRVSDRFPGMDDSGVMTAELAPDHGKAVTRHAIGQMHPYSAAA